ncbi:MAG: hypothetical protein ICV83_02495 [Cytophagales bacterium]|nr:hypothetical protein [Cytophagales bacterium]
MEALATHRQTVLSLLVAGLISLTFLLFRPLPKATLLNCGRVTGQLVQIQEGGTKDIVFKLRNDNDTYYINRGLERGLTLEEMKRMEGKEISLYFVEHWTPFDAMHQVRHVAKVEVGERIVYDEIEK